MLFKRKDSPIWWVSFTVRGRRTRRSSGTTDKAQALELHDRWKSEAWREITLKEKPKFGWKEAALKWLLVKSEKATIHDDEAHLLFIQNFWKGKKLSEIGKEEIDSLKVKKKATGVSNATVNRMLSLVRAILRMSFKLGWIESVPPVELMPEPKKRIRWLTKEEAAKLLSYLPEHQERIARFALLTGLRQGNILGLEWSQVDLVRKVLWIHADQAKGRKAIGIPLPDAAVTLLRELSGQHPQWVFTYKGNRINQVNTLAWRKALKKAGIENFRWHDLRHCWASWHIQDGTPLYALKELGGWESMDMVMRYSHMAPEHLAPYVQKKDIVTNLSRTLKVV